MKIFSYLLMLFCTFYLSYADYKVPVGSSSGQMTHVEVLKKLDEAFVDLSKKASKSVVFIGISKSLPIPDAYEMNPFEESFGFPFGPYAPRQRGKNPRGLGRGQKVEGVGSGFIIDNERGYILTNNHVVGDADEIKVTTSDGHKYQAKVIGTDPKTDIAVIQVKGLSKELGQIFLADSDQLQIGQWVVAVGAPHGLAQTVTRGSVSAKGRGSLDIIDQGDFIQTDAAINPGNSGGPLVDVNGDAVGMNSAIISQSGGYQGIGLAIPSNLLRQVAEGLIQNGKVKRGMIGIYIQNLNEELAQDFSLPEQTKGVLVVNVQKGGAADKAGIQHGDIIVKVDGKELRDGSQLSYLISLNATGKDIQLEIMRKGKMLSVKVRPTLTQTASNDHGSVNEDKEKEISVDEKWGFALAETSHGVIIQEVRPGSPADAASLRSGDQIVEVNQATIKSIKDFHLHDQKKGRLLLRVVREDQYFYISLKR